MNFMFIVFLLLRVGIIGSHVNVIHQSHPGGKGVNIEEIHDITRIIHPEIDGTRVTGLHVIDQFDSSTTEEYDEVVTYTTRREIIKRLVVQQNLNEAKNVIIFVGDNLPTASVRITDQTSQVCLKTFNIFENDYQARNTLENAFRHSGYFDPKCVDDEYADVACTTTSILTGVNVKRGTVSIDDTDCCDKWSKSCNRTLASVIADAQDAGKRTGLVTTSRLTSPGVSPVYGHTTHSDWESDCDVDRYRTRVCKNCDLAAQLVAYKTGQRLNVILGGGGKKFLPKGQGGERRDRRNLIKEWLDSKRTRSCKYAFVETLDDLEDTSSNIDYLLGIFNKKEVVAHRDPSLADMTAAAIRILEQDDGVGYMLFVQAEHIDPIEDIDSKHYIDEMSRAIKTAYRMTNDKETLIVITTAQEEVNEETVFDSSDFSTDEDSSTSTCQTCGCTAPVHNFVEYPAVYANGPHAHLFNGRIENRWIADFIRYAGCLGDGYTSCNEECDETLYSY